MLSITLPKAQAADIHKLAVVISPEKNESVDLINLSIIEQYYKEYGLILLRGFDVNISSFKRITSQLCSSSVLNGSGNRDTIDVEHNIQTVNLGRAAFALHPELAREPWKPDACFFTCLSPPKNDGETLLCDGVALLEQLPSAIKEILSEKTLRYTSAAQPEELAYWLGTQTPSVKDLQEKRPKSCPFTFFINPEHQIMRSFKAPALHRTMYSQKEAFGNFILFARFTGNTTRFPTYGDFTEIPQKLVNQIQSVAQSMQVSTQWQKGDLLLIDNTRFLHGRNKITNIKERKILSYFGFMRCAALNEDEINLPWRREQWYDRVPLNFHRKTSRA